ncbi:MAG: hypothetical protein EPO13_01960 [Actinomycetota bacterium]|nr:MAG: hypothetical protein EPO13_01960 [Actinomycetota bacterium]
MTGRHRITRSVLAAAVLAVPAVGTISALPATAAPAPALQLSASRLTATGPTTITVTGTGYLVPPHAPGAEVFGGVYLAFGWVKPGGSWGPSHRSSSSDNGTFGVSYAYPGDGGGADTRDDGSGGVRLISFTGGGLSGEATAFHMDPGGNWPAGPKPVTLVVPGARFSYLDSAGAKHTVDCQQVQCGVFTIGAHGKASATNEVFAPLTFVGKAGASGQASAKPTARATPQASATATPKPTPKASSASAPAQQPSDPVPSVATSDTPTAAATPTSSVSTDPAASAGAPSAATPTAEQSAIALAAGSSPGTDAAPRGWWVVAAAVLVAAVSGAVLVLTRRSAGSG